MLQRWCGESVRTYIVCFKDGVESRYGPILYASKMVWRVGTDLYCMLQRWCGESIPTYIVCFKDGVESRYGPILYASKMVWRVDTDLYCMLQRWCGESILTYIVCFCSSDFILWKVSVHLISVKVCIVRLTVGIV